VDAFMAFVQVAWRKVGIPVRAFTGIPSSNLSLTSKSWRFPVVALGTIQVAPNSARNTKNVT